MEKLCGKDFTIDDLFTRGYKAVFLSIGCDMPRKLNVPGKEKRGVYFAKDFLKRADNIKFENVIVVGGGNVAMDAARMAKSKGAKSVTVLYRRERVDMKASQIEIIKAIESGINIVPNSVVSEITGTESVGGVKCTNGNSYHADTVIIAIGTLPDLTVLDDLKLTDNDLVAIDEYGETSKENVFAGGDLTESSPNVSRAIASSIRAVNGIERKMKLSKQNLS